jgi:hypothetical protein
MNKEEIIERLEILSVRERQCSRNSNSFALKSSIELINKLEKEVDELEKEVDALELLVRRLMGIEVKHSVTDKGLLKSDIWFDALERSDNNE